MGYVEKNVQLADVSVKFLKLFHYYINYIYIYYFMAQKSLPVLNKINVSMTWYVTVYNKYYKWLSLNLLFCTFMFIKILTTFDLLNLKLIWQDGVLTKYSHERMFNKFFYPVTLYIVDMGSFSLIYNFFYKTSLERFQFITEYTKNKNKSYGKNLNLKKNTVWLK